MKIKNFKAAGGSDTEIRKLSWMNFFLNLFFLSPVAVFFYQQRGLDYFQILALESILVLFMFFFEVPTGIVADRFGRKKSVIVGTLFLVMNPLILLFAQSFVFFGIAFAFSGIGITFHSGCIEALIYDRLKSEGKEGQMKKAMGSFSSVALVAMVVAPIIGSLVAKDLFMSQFLFLILMTVGAMLIGFILSLFLRDTQQRIVKENNPLRLLGEGVRLLRQNMSLLRIVLLSMFSSPFLIVLTYLYQPYFQASGIDTRIFGIVFGVALLLSAFFQKYAYRFEEIFGMEKAIFLATALPGVFYILMAFVFHPIWAIVLFVMNRAIMGLRGPLFSEYKNTHIPSNVRATALSLISMFVSLYSVAMRLLIGKIADIGLGYSFLFMGIMIIVASLFLRIDKRHT